MNQVKSCHVIRSHQWGYELDITLALRERTNCTNVSLTVWQEQQQRSDQIRVENERRFPVQGLSDRLLARRDSSSR